MSNAQLVATMQTKDRAVDAAIVRYLDSEGKYIGQEVIADYITQTMGAHSISAMERLNNLGLIERDPTAGRRWGLSRDGRELAAQLRTAPAAGPDTPTDAQIRRERRERRGKRAAAK